MAKRGKFQLKSATGVENAVEEIPEKVILVSVVAVYPSVIKYTSPITGKSYVWSGAGDVQQVDQKDVPALLAKRIGNRGCCGAVNQDGNKVFELQEA